MRDFRRSKRKSEDGAGALNSPQITAPASTNGTPGAKRKLEEDPEAAIPQPPKSQKTYKKHETHWNLDGSLLLQIGNTRFKVHRSRLASESPWFAALLDQRSGAPQPEPYSYQAEIDKVLASAEKVDGIDLFFLDIEDAPKVEDFSALLTAMNSGINFVYEPPTREEIVRLYKAAFFYEMKVYQKFCEKYFLNLFPDDGMSLPASPSVDLAVQGILLGREYPNLSAILRPAFYDLARAPLIEKDEPMDFGDKPATNASQGTQKSGTPSQGEPIDDAEEEETSQPLEKLSISDFIALLDLQKRLALTWDGIFNAIKYTCNTGKCTLTHRAKIDHIKHECPYDPILAIQQILDRTSFAKSYCDESAKEVKRLLKAERDGIWEDIKYWLKPEDNEE